jgi:hypothetical protein
MLKHILEKVECDITDWIDLAENVDYFRAHVTTAMKIRFHKILGIS